MFFQKCNEKFNMDLPVSPPSSTVQTVKISTAEKPKEIIEQKDLKQITDSGEIEKVIVKILTENAGKVEEYKSGKEKLYGYFVGQVMKATKGKANPKLVNEILKKKLAK